MFSEDQSDVQEFFLYLVDEISKEVDSLSSNPQSPIIHNTNNEELLSNINDAFNSVIGEKYRLKNTGKICVIPLFKITDDVIQIIIDSEFK